METLPWYKSKILQAQLAMMVVSLLGLVGVSADWLEAIPKILEVCFAIVPLLITLYTILVRLFRPVPPVTERAAEKEREMILSGKLDSAVPVVRDVPGELRDGGQL